MFTSGLDLVQKLLDCVRVDSPWGPVDVGLEFFYQRGRTDVVLVDDDGSIIALEAKLYRWRQALQQAYRNTCFAHRSYIVLPEDAALLAQRHALEFSRRGIGICYVSADGVAIVQEARENTPIQPWLSDQALSWVTGDGELCQRFS